MIDVKNSFFTERKKLEAYVTLYIHGCYNCTTGKPEITYNLWNNEQDYYIWNSKKTYTNKDSALRAARRAYAQYKMYGIVTK